MTTPRVLILRAPGTNCDQESAFAFEKAGASVTPIHVNALLEHPAAIHEFQILCLPGGFSYGDDISAGRILGNQFRHHLCDVLREFKSQGKLILGICNGFQILVKSGLLLPDHPSTPTATLAGNQSGKFEDRWVNLAVTGQKCVFLQGIESMYLPVAHGEGNFMARDAATLNALDANGQLCLRYAAATSDSSEVPYPLNPNGAQKHVAGVCDESGRVLGLMPHPERHIDFTHHPRWTRRDHQPSHGDGFTLFVNAVKYFR
jgi:phosphoribosylformylglycinamidine synthase subunit PurQ / glutaminase